MAVARWNLALFAAAFLAVAVAGFVLHCEPKKPIKSQPAECNISPDDLEFGTVAVGRNLDKSAIITNTGDVAISVNLSDSCSEDFSVISGGSSNLRGGESDTVTVRFAPKSAGEKECLIETGNSACGRIRCLGLGGEPAACNISPDTLDFGCVSLDSSRDMTFTIENTGGDTLSGEVRENCNDYSIIAGGGSYELSSGYSRAVTVRYTPNSIDTSDCRISVGNAACREVYCIGVGKNPPKCTVSVSSLNFGQELRGNTVSRQFSVTNSGGDALNGNVNLDGDCEGLVLESGNGEFSLSEGQSRTVEVSFRPEYGGEYRCSVNIGSELCQSVECVGWCRPVVTTRIVGYGFVSKDPDSSSYSYSSSVKLTAHPDPGQLFHGWSGDLQGIQNPVIVIMTKDWDITATFEKSHLIEVMGRVVREDGEPLVKPIVFLDTSSSEMVVPIDNRGWIANPETGEFHIVYDLRDLDSLLASVAGFDDVNENDTADVGEPFGWWDVMHDGDWNFPTDFVFLKPGEPVPGAYVVLRIPGPSAPSPARKRATNISLQIK